MEKGIKTRVSHFPATDKPLLGRFWLAGDEERVACPGVMVLDAKGASLQLEGALSASPLVQDAQNRNAESGTESGT